MSKLKALGIGRHINRSWSMPGPQPGREAGTLQLACQVHHQLAAIHQNALVTAHVRPPNSRYHGKGLEQSRARERDARVSKASPHICGIIARTVRELGQWSTGAPETAKDCCCVAMTELMAALRSSEECSEEIGGFWSVESRANGITD